MQPEMISQLLVISAVELFDLRVAVCVNCQSLIVFTRIRLDMHDHEADGCR